jgi:predicted metal-dependent peptidase
MKHEDALPIEEWVRAARVHAAECVGWFAPALYAAPLHLSDALPAPAAIDRYGRVYFNPQWVARLYEACGQDRHALVRQLAQVWYHEVAHWLREHEARAQALHADARLWNLAADMEINDYLPEGMAYPSLGGEPLAVLPRRYNLPDGEIAEWYYQRLVERAQQVQLATGDKGEGDGGMQVSESPLTPTLSPLDKGGEGAGSGGISTPDEGAGSGGTQGSGSPLTPTLSPLRKGGEGAGSGGISAPDKGAGSGGTQGSGSPLTPTLSPLDKGGEGAGSGGISTPDEGAGSGGTQGGGSPLTPTLSPLAKGGEGAGSGGILLWDEGSGVHGQARPWELHADDPSTNALSDFDRQALQEEVARRIVEHQKERGIAPAGWLRWAEAILKPKVNWREQLKRILRGVISEGLGHRLDYSYRRPHRRSAVYHPIYLPALQGEYKPRVACVVDTSGSISDRELMQSLAEVRAVLEALRIPVTIIPCDAVPYEAIRVFDGSDWLKVRQGLRGGGGTDMVAGLNAALALKPKPEAVIVLTDGHTPFPSTRPKDTAVIWAIWQYGDGEPPKPPMPPWRARDVVVVPIDAA